MFIEMNLKHLAFTLEEVQVKPNFFDKPVGTNTSTRTLSSEEIRRSPGGLEDVNRVMMSMPGIVQTSDQTNHLVVRGGHPRENLTVLDMIEIPNSNHFGEQGSTGGTISMINTDLIREIDFSSGGFPVRYGDKLSSVLNIQLREGNRHKVETDISIGMAGAGLTVEGPIIKKKGSWLLSMRKSYLGLVKGPTSLTAVPEYGDLQAKVVYDPTPKNQISMVGIGGSDHVHITDQDDLYNRGWNNVLYHTRQYGIGLNWRTLFSRNGYSILTCSQVFNQSEFLVGDRRGPDAMSMTGSERETTIKAEINYDISTKHGFSIGTAVKEIELDHIIRSREVEFYSNETGKLIKLTHQDQDSRLSTFKASSFVHYKVTPTAGLDLNFGLRGDYFNLTETTNFSPRFGTSYQISSHTVLNGSFGYFYQPMSYIFLNWNQHNKNLDSMQAKHYIIGLEHLFDQDFRLTIEAYIKDYQDYILLNDKENLILNNNATGYARGVDMFAQKQLTNRIYGLISYSYLVSRFKSPELDEFDSDFDTRHVFTLIGGYRLSDQWEFSGKWRYISGKPYTPIIGSDEVIPGDWEPIFADGINVERFPSYHRLDFRLDRRLHFPRWNLVTYFEIENIYNRRNIWSYEWDRSKGKNREIHQFGFFPIGGIRLEF